MKALSVSLLYFFFFLAAGSARCAELQPELKPVDFVDVSRCAGKWYEIAKYPNFLQRNLVGGTAEWTQTENGDIRVFFLGRKGNLKGKEVTAKLKGWIVDKNTNAKFRIMYFWPFSGEYWIIDRGINYEYAVVSKPSRGYLWILCREPKMDEKVYDGILARLVTQCFDISKLKKTPQPGEELSIDIKK